MAPTRNAASPLASIAKIYSGISFINPVLFLNLGMVFAISKAVETSNLVGGQTKILGTTPQLVSSGLFQASSMILGGGIMKPFSWLIDEPARHLVYSAVGPFLRRRRESGVSEVDPQDGGLPTHEAVAPASHLAPYSHSKVEQGAKFI